MAANTGKTVLVHYVGTLDDGSVFDSSREREPFTFVVGSGSVIPGFDATVGDMTVGEKTTFIVRPDEAYGDYDDTLIETIPLEVFDGKIPAAGQMVMLQDQDGNQFAGTVKSATMDSVEMDFNHPLAGKPLTFELELIEVKDTPAEDADEDEEE